MRSQIEQEHYIECLRRNNKVNIAGRASCLGLLLLAFLLVNPIVGSSARAMEGDGGESVTDGAVSALAEGANGTDWLVDGGGRVADGSASDDADEGIMPTAVGSNVGISFNPVSGSASLTPTNAEGASAKINVSADVSISNTGGYTIYLSGKNAALTGNKTGQTIPATSTTTTFANLKTNTWGYAAVEGLNVSDTTTYAALPQGQGIKLAEGSGNATNVKRTFTLSFATKVGNDKPADTYSNQVVISVTSSPKTITFTDYTTTMQGMTSSICETVDTGAEAQLRDTRDGKYYWVAKLADGKCWMTQNLDLDLSTSKALTSADSDVASSWTPGFTTATQATSSTVNPSSQVETRSWSLGNYRITNPTTSSDCGYPKNDLSQCTEQFTPYTTPTTVNGDELAHYIVGNHYQWNAATAGTGGSITEGQATSSICPKGWRLPTSGVDGSELQELLQLATLVIAWIGWLVHHIISCVAE